MLTRYLCICRLSFIANLAKRSEVKDTAAAAAAAAATTVTVTDGWSGVVTRSQSDSRNLVPFRPGSNIPVEIHNDKSVLKIVVKQMEGDEKETAKKMATAATRSLN